ncbi:SGNH/GDSL hydrolase family protein [Haloechinothrix sp. YIM 98757]|uniref:SGNH/GDSL hydrolase family protein n=1 Tax=Haloechinothrix aidingensis TaxID=2752311 RepID=A0A838ADT1_9PSEU|nr:SGNH/GDSL hydrolase family protein [Haloechinothrix aidingensis]MBA0127315.1 SGNH/GDSL hydrolase family protein [Haloechinothrix aidingensis]
MSSGTYGRYVALGDSQTEGLWDGDDENGLRGWADRLAGQLAELNPELHYANLAVRGRLAHQVRAEQLDAALALEPDLATVVAGMNDLLRPGFDADAVAGELEHMFAALTDAGATVATLTFPDVAKLVPIAKPLTHRVVSLNARIHEAAVRHGVAILETFHHPVTTDPRIWSPDRLHASPLGHERIAAGMAYALGLPGSSADWREPLPPLPSSGSMHFTKTELWWLASFLGPWIGRRVRGRSSGDGRAPKRPDLTPAR